MKTHTKKRLEIFVEAPVLNRLLDALDQVGVSGYTVLPALAGRGAEGRWSREGQITTTSQIVQVVTIIDQALADQALSAAYHVVARQIGIVSLSDVEVVRDDHF